MEKRIDSPLCSAITAGDKEKVKQLLDGGANPDDFQQETKQGMRNDWWSVADAWVPTPYDYNERNHALHLAAKRGDAEIISLLLAKGADPNKLNTGDGKWQSQLTPLHVAALEGKAEAAEALCKGGAIVNWNDSSIISTFRETAMHLAAAKGHIDVCRVLLAHGASENDIDMSHKNPIHYGCTYGQLEVVRFFIEERGMPVDAPISYSGYKDSVWRSTTLLEAVDANQKDVVEYLLNKWADIHALNEFGSQPDELHKRTALHLAYMRKNVDLAKYLISRGADPKALDGKQREPEDYIKHEY